MPNASEAFNMVVNIYDTLEDASKRNTYDQIQNGGPPLSGSGSNPAFGTIPVGTASITIQSSSNFDTQFTHLNDIKGTILNYQPQMGIYTAKIDNGTMVHSSDSSLF